MVRSVAGNPPTPGNGDRHDADFAFDEWWKPIDPDTPGALKVAFKHCFRDGWDACVEEIRQEAMSRD